MSVVLEDEVNRMFTPDKGLYPKYDAWLETSLRNEPIEFFREMFACGK